jgi:NADH:ubiquinone oxidoreductase subunit 5 (subunit L)/multisubunit Na+/H+ antiporter MnhA subunit
LPLYVVGLLSISGIPPFNGFYSKAIIVKSVNAQFPAYALLSGLVGALTLLSFMKLGWYLFLRNRAGGNGSSTPPPSVIVVCSALALVCLLQGVLAPQMLALTDLGLGVTGADTPVPSLLKPSPLTIVGYLGILVAILIWAGKSAVYAIFTSGRLGFVGAVARRELYFESAYLNLSRAGHAASDLASRISSGSIRDYVAYIIIAWAAGLALELGGTLI